MMGDGGLSETDHVMQSGTFPTSTLFRKVMKYLEAVAVSQGLGYFFDLL